MVALPLNIRGTCSRDCAPVYFRNDLLTCALSTTFLGRHTNRPFASNVLPCTSSYLQRSKRKAHPTANLVARAADVARVLLLPRGVRVATYVVSLTTSCCVLLRPYSVGTCSVHGSLPPRAVASSTVLYKHCCSAVVVERVSVKPCFTLNAMLYAYDCHCLRCCNIAE